jgi:hypothetical protein
MNFKNNLIVESATPVLNVVEWSRSCPFPLDGLLLNRMLMLTCPKLLLQGSTTNNAKEEVEKEKMA